LLHVHDITHFSGYEEEQLSQIRKIIAVIKKHGKFSPNSSDVLVTTIFVCLNVEEHSVPFPVFRIPGCDPEVRNSVMLTN
jgi:hypothetical protein